MILVYQMLSFKPPFSLSSFTFIEKLLFFAFYHKGGVICVSEVVDILPAILIPSCDSSILAFHMMYSAFTEKPMATHSSTLAWKIPWTEEPGGLQSMGSLSRTRLSDFPFTFHFHALEKEMATHSSVIAWRIPGMGEPGGLPSMGSHRVGHD